METEKKKRIQPPWTPERRENLRAFCLAAAMVRKKLNKRMASTHEHTEFEKIIDLLSKIEGKYGIDPHEILGFIFLLPKGQPPFSEEQAKQWREMAILKVPAAEIYQHLFGTPAMT